jgi:CPA1 family monovalent cation:H+ antiporter
MTISLLTPFACYLAAEATGASGVLAVVVCGLYYGWRAPAFNSSRFRLRAYPIWEIVQFLLNGVIFILIGLELPEVISALAGRSLAQVLWFATVILVPLILLRLGWLFAMTYLPRVVSGPLCKGQTPQSWRHVLLMGWTGMRGVDSLAAALAVPLAIRTGAAFPDRDLIFFLTFAVIFGTLVLQGLSLEPVVRWLGVVDDKLWEAEERSARLTANQAALARVHEFAGSRPVDQSAVRRLAAEYEDRILQLQNHSANEPADPALFSQDFAQVTREALEVERRTILGLRDRRVINDATLRRIQRDIDLAESRFQREGA